MRVSRYITIAAVLLLAAHVSDAQMIPDNVGKSSNGLPLALVNVGFDPQLNAQLPLDVNFVDENSQLVILREYFGQKRPVVLTFVYFTCPMLC